jgi:hypothetical protein
MWAAAGPIGLAIGAVAAIGAWAYAEGGARGVGKLDHERDMANDRFDSGDITGEEYDALMNDINQREAALAPKAADAIKAANDALKKNEESADKAGTSAEDWANKLITGGKAAGKAAGDAAKKLADEAKSAHEKIQSDWLATTQSREKQLEAWYQKELETLDKSKDANADYLDDLKNLRETYEQKQAEVDYAKRSEKNSVYRQYRDEDTSRQVKQQSFSIADPMERKSFDIQAEYAKQFQGILDKYDDFNAKFASMTEAQKELYREALTEAGVAFAENAQGELDFQAQIYEEKEALELEHSERQKELTEEYCAWERDAHKTQEEYMREINNALYDGLQTSIKGLLDGTMSISDAWKSLKDSMVNTFIQMAAQAIASNLMVSLGIKPIAAGLAAAWAPAATLASLATSGGNSSPAQAGMLAASSIAEAIAGAGVGLAEGGPVYGSGTATSDSVPAMLSNGEYVIQAAAVKRIGAPALDALNRGQAPRFAGGGLSGGNSMYSLSSLGASSEALSNGAVPARGGNSLAETHTSQTNVTIQALDGKSVERLLRKNGGALVRSLGEQAALFNTGKLRTV